MAKAFSFSLYPIRRICLTNKGGNSIFLFNLCLVVLGGWKMMYANNVKRSSLNSPGWSPVFFVLTIIFLLVFRAEAAQFTLKSGEVIYGEIGQKEVSFKSNYGTIKIKIECIESFSDNQLRLKDGSILQGGLADKNLKIKTNSTTLSIQSKDIVTINPAERPTTQQNVQTFHTEVPEVPEVSKTPKGPPTAGKPIKLEDGQSINQ